MMYFGAIDTPAAISSRGNHPQGGQIKSAKTEEEMSGKKQANCKWLDLRKRGKSCVCQGREGVSTLPDVGEMLKRIREWKQVLPV